MHVTGNTIFIPGSTSGIGLALALRLHTTGNTVVVGGRRTELLEQIALEPDQPKRKHGKHDGDQGGRAEHPPPDAVGCYFRQLALSCEECQVCNNRLLPATATARGRPWAVTDT